jgi:putative FmdB family regulatory protein
MPIYEYRCGACSHELEALQKVSDSPLRKCPECGRLALRRLISAPVFRLKGGGWYETDFKGNGEKKRNLVETSSGESSDSSAAADSAKSGDAAAKSADAAAKSADTTNKAADAKKPPEKPAASEVKKPATARGAKRTRT